MSLELDRYLNSGANEKGEYGGNTEGWTKARMITAREKIRLNQPVVVTLGLTLSTLWVSTNTCTGRRIILRLSVVKIILPR